MNGQKKYRVGIIGLDHTHARLLFSKFRSLCGERVEWVGYAQIEKATGAVLEFNKYFYEPLYDAMKEYDHYMDLLNQNLDIAIVCTDTNMHANICEETLKRNIHTIVEKPMAIDLDDAVRMYQAAKNSRAELVINWPIAWFPHFNKVKELLDEGVIGKPLRFVYRTPQTWGPFTKGFYSDKELSEFWWYDKERGGGSIMDYACYGCVLSAWIFGEELPKRVVGFKKNFFTPDCLAEDYGKFLIEYENAIAEVEGSWSTAHSGEVPTGPIVYGTEGTIVTDRYTNEVKVYKKIEGSDDEVKVYTVQEEDIDIPVNFMNHLEKNEPLHEQITLELNMRAMALLDACLKASDKNEVIEIKKIW